MELAKTERFAVVTGAGSGLGRCFALELAGRGLNTILVDLNRSSAVKVAEEARRLGTESISIEADLTDRESVGRVCDIICGNYRIFALVNNAGAGGSARFTECPDGYIERIISLNVTAVALLTHRLLPSLMKADHAFILNVSSMAAFTPIGYKTVYPASKRFIYDFTRGLREELRNTNPDVTDRIERQGRFGRIGLLSPEEVARKGIEGMFRREAVIIPGLMNKFNKMLTDIVPARIRLPLVSRIVARELQQ